MRNEFYQHKKSDKIKWIITGIAFVLAFVMIAGICMQLFGNDKLKPSNWFKKTECVHIDENTDGKCDECGEDMPDDKSETADGSGLVVTPTSSKVMKLTASPLSVTVDDDKLSAPMGVETYANTNSYTLTATITPSTASNQSVDWAVAWNNASSTWASGKTVTDYVTVTPTSDGALTATVTCKKAFGEKIKITVTSRESSSYSADCVCDYSKKVVGFTVSGNGYGVDASGISFTENLTLYTAEKSFVALTPITTLKYSDYTLDDTFSHTCTATINPAYSSYLSSAGLTPNHSNPYHLMGGTAFFYAQCKNPGGITVNPSYCQFTAAQANQAIAIAKQHTNIVAYNWKITCTGTYSTYEYTIPVYFSESSLTSAVTGISLNNSGLTF